MQKCQFWLHKKHRNCKFTATPGHKYCGNHLNLASGDGLPRVLCPIDPRHTVLASELKAHLDKCPYLLQQRERKVDGALQAQPYFVEGCNEGSDGELNEDTTDDRTQGPATLVELLSLPHARAAYASGLGQAGFAALVSKVEAAYERVCAAPIPQRQEPHPAAEQHWQADPLRPFSLKHALQQACIVGNMKRAGLLDNAASRMFIEFGAGKGYLSSMLADCAGATELVLVDHGSFRFKADRSLRRADGVGVRRLRIDIKDFEVAGVEGLRGGAPPWVAAGKHLCGSATDLTLRCCLRSRRHHAAAASEQHAHGGAAGLELATGTSSSVAPSGLPARGADAVSLHSPTVSGPGSGAVQQPPTASQQLHHPQQQAHDAGGGGTDGTELSSSASGLQGLAVATCCHHRCCWRHYVNKAFFRGLGITAQEFEVVCWMTGWALCGHEAPAGEGAAAEDAGESEHTPAVATNSSQVLDDHPAGANGIGGDGSGISSSLQRPFDPCKWLRRADKISVGQKCKRLIDRGRLLWLQEKGFKAEMIAYVESSVSGENTLLLATTE